MCLVTSQNVTKPNSSQSNARVYAEVTSQNVTTPKRLRSHTLVKRKFSVSQNVTKSQNATLQSRGALFV